MDWGWGLHSLMFCTSFISHQVCNIICHLLRDPFLHGNRAASESSQQHCRQDADSILPATHHLQLQLQPTSSSQTGVHVLGAVASAYHTAGHPLSPRGLTADCCSTTQVFLDIEPRAQLGLYRCLYQITCQHYSVLQFGRSTSPESLFDLTPCQEHQSAII